MASFKPLKLQLHGCQGVYHYIYFKQHSSKQDSEGLPRKRTLFVLNPPLDAEHALASVFEEAGAVEAVRDTVMQVQQREHRPVKAAYVIFEQAAGLTKALGLDLTKKRSLPASSAEGESFGLRRWQQEYEAQRPDTKALQSKIDADMQQFDDDQAQSKALELAMDGKEDEQGWTYVAKGGKLVTEDAEEATPLPTKHKKDRELKNFYRFQMKEARKEQIAVLRKKFDLDKLRVAQMRGDRKFRPY